MEQELLHTLTLLTRADGIYQDLLGQCSAWEEKYNRVLCQLSEQDRVVIERYLALCDELEYRRTCIALAMNTSRLKETTDARTMTDY